MPDLCSKTRVERGNFPADGRATLKVVIAHDLVERHVGNFPADCRATLKVPAEPVQCAAAEGNFPADGRATLKDVDAQKRFDLMLGIFFPANGGLR